ncbi:MAG: TrkA C-terminal domain-containing protein [Fodinibius sp.]|nr:TrkA C-terminal domain-containing protein [Fodinibius sp.]
MICSRLRDYLRRPSRFPKWIPNEENAVLIEAVVSPSHPINGETIKKGKFRNKYDAVVLAVSRNGERVEEKVGDIRLRTGDTLLLEAHPNFLKQYKNSSDYFLISGIRDSNPPSYDKSSLFMVYIGIHGRECSLWVSHHVPGFLFSGGIDDL